MIFLIDVHIARPVAEVWAAFTDRTRLSEWQATFRTQQSLVGIAGELGAVSRLTYREGGRDVEMTETIVEHAAPSLLTQELVASMMSSTLRNRFARLGDDETRWTVEGEIRFRGAWVLMGLIARRLIVGKTRADTQRFKRLLESGDALPAEAP